MSIKDILAELQNIKEQAVNEDGITKDSILEAITDLIHDVGGNDGLDGLSVLGFILGIVGCILLLGVTVLVELLV